MRDTLVSLITYASAFLAILAGANAQVNDGFPTGTISKEQELSNKERHPVVVRLKVPEGISSKSLQNQKDIVQEVTTNFLALLPEGSASENDLSDVEVVRTFSYTPIIALDANRDGIKFLERLPDVESVEIETPDKPFLKDSVSLIGADKAWSIPNGNGNGNGTFIAILDNGISPSHKFLKSRISHQHEACFSRTKKCPNGKSQQIGRGAASSNEFHGTHVAGIAAGLDGILRSRRIDGVAHGATLIPIDVFSGNGSWPIDQLSALEYLLELRTNTNSPMNVVAANMSLGGTKRYMTNCDSEEFERAPMINNLRNSGVAIVIAAGNDGDSNGVSAPGCISGAITVSSVTKSDKIWSRSNRSTITDFFAPGVHIFSSSPDGDYRPASGTSMAAPHVAGAIAILSGAVPSAGLTDILRVLNKTSHTVTDTEPPHRKYFRIDVNKALLRLKQEQPEKLSERSISLGEEDNVTGESGKIVINKNGEEIATISIIDRDRNDCKVNLGFFEYYDRLIPVPCSSLIATKSDKIYTIEIPEKLLYEMSTFSKNPQHTIYQN